MMCQVLFYTLPLLFFSSLFLFLFISPFSSFSLFLLFWIFVAFVVVMVVVVFVCFVVAEIVGVQEIAFASNEQKRRGEKS